MILNLNFRDLVEFGRLSLERTYVPTKKKKGLINYNFTIAEQDLVKF